MKFWILVHSILSVQKSPPRIPPAPSCAAEIQTPPFQKICLVFANHSSRKIVSQKRVRIAFAHRMPEYLEGRTPKEKHPFLFQKNPPPAKSEMQGVFFLSGLPPSPRGGAECVCVPRTSALQTLNYETPFFPFFNIK